MIERSELMENGGNAITVENVSFCYKNAYSVVENKQSFAIKNINLNILQGEYIALLGSNGSGKSTLAKLINIIETPMEGNIVVLGNEVTNEEAYWDIRTSVQCVFQNPDNQIVGSTVEEDVAFGPENIGIPNPKLREIVDNSIKMVNIEDIKTKDVSKLSGGQKQKVAIAGVLALNPRILILDEATSMLDPIAREEFLNTVEELKAKLNLTLITITHDMNEAMRADRIVILDNGEVVEQGKTAVVFKDEKNILKYGLELPQYIKLSTEIDKMLGISCDDLTHYVTKLDTLKHIKNILCNNHKKLQMIQNVQFENECVKIENKSDLVLKVENLSYKYSDSDSNQYAIKDLSFDIKRGDVVALVGKSGCGKTTLVSHLNAIYPTQKGKIEIINSEGNVISTVNKKDIKSIRRSVGLVFQYPEYQLFEETVYKDIEFGLKKQKIDENTRRQRIYDTIELINLPSDILTKSPFDLSGGQKRKVAIAGVLAMRPEILVLDEPAAGLDPRGKQEIFGLIKKLKQQGITIIVVSHNMDDVINFADRTIIMNDGKIVYDEPANRIFRHREHLEEYGVKIPIIHSLMYDYCKLDSVINDDLINQIAKIRNYKDAVSFLVQYELNLGENNVKEKV